MSNFSFSSLVLSGVKAAAGVSVLDPGKYVCTVTDVEVRDTKDQKGKRLVVKLRDVQGKGVITAFINIFLPNSQKATEIGLEQLKALLVHGGHPDPDNIGNAGLQSIKNLTVGVIVGTDKREDNTKTSEVKGFCDPKTVKGYEQSASGDGSPAIDPSASAATGATPGKKLPF